MCTCNNNRLSGISKLSRCELLALVNATALALADGLEEDDLDTLGSFLSSVGDLIGMFASLCEAGESGDSLTPPQSASEGATPPSPA